MLFGFVGLIVERISGSEFMYNVLPNCCCWAVALSAVQALNGLGPDATTGAAPAATATTTSATAHTPPSVTNLLLMETSSRRSRDPSTPHKVLAGVAGSSPVPRFC